MDFLPAGASLGLTSSEHFPLTTEKSSQKTAPMLSDDEKEPSSGMIYPEHIPTKDSHSDAKNTLLGMLCVTTATLLICTLGAIVQGEGGSVFQWMEGRYFVQNLISIGWWKLNKPANVQKWYGDAPHRGNIWLRGLLNWILIFTWFQGVHYLPLGDADAIFFISPVLIVLVGYFYLKEPLPKCFPITVILTAAGVLCICQPVFLFGSEDSEPVSYVGLIFMGVSALSWTWVAILVRTATSAHFLQLEFAASVQAAYLWTPLLVGINRLFFKSEDISGGDWAFSFESAGMMLVLGVVGFVGLCLSVVGYQIGNATKVAWMEYLDLVFAFLYQWLVFGDAPNMWEILGGVLLIATCIIHVSEEMYHFYSFHDSPLCPRLCGGQNNCDEPNAGDFITSETIQVEMSEKEPLLVSGSHSFADSEQKTSLEHCTLP